ncbi:MAG: transglutaminase domain-containing protein, partial [Patescibacteria group bacterium]
AFIIANVPIGKDYTLSAAKTGSTFKTYTVQAFTDGLTLGFVNSTDDTRLSIAIYSGTTTDTDSDGLPDNLETSLETNPSAADTDNDGLSDYDEYLKYRTNPNLADSDSDGTNDNDWDERREYTYSIKVHGKTLLRADIDSMNDFFQDAKSLGTFTYNSVTGLEYEAIIYPDAVQLLIPKINYAGTYSSSLDPYLGSSATITLSPQMKEKVQDIVEQISVATDLNVVDTLLKWLRENSLDVISEVSGGYGPSMLFEMTATEGGFSLLRQNTPNAYRTANGEQTFERFEIFSDQQFRSGIHGSCGSTTELLTGLLRAAGIPIRMMNAIPLFPHENEAYYQTLIAGLHNTDLQTLLTGYISGENEIMNHFTPEAYINGQWVRMDQVGPDDAGIGPLLDGMPNIKLLSMADYTEFDMAGNEGALGNTGPNWGDIGSTPLYHTISLTDQYAIHTPSGTLPSKETESYNLPSMAALQAPTFLQPGVIIVNDAARSSATIDQLQAKNIAAIVAGKDRNLIIDDFTLTGASNKAYIESATAGVSVADIDVYSLEFYAGDTVNLTGDINKLYATVLTDLAVPAVHDFTIIDSSALDVTYLWHNNGKIRISSGSNKLDADEIITYLAGSVMLTSEGALSTIENITSVGGLTLAKTTTAATYTVGAYTINIGGALTINPGVTLTFNNTTVDYNGAGAQTIPALNYYNLVLSNAGVKTLAAGTTRIANALAVRDAASFDATTNSTAIEYNGSGAQNIPALNYRYLVLSNAGVKTLAAGTTKIANALAVRNAASFDTTTNSTAIEYNGSGAQNIPALNYRYLVLSNAGVKTLAAGTTKIANALAVRNAASFDTTTNSTVIEYNGSGAQNIPALNYR